MLSTTISINLKKKCRTWGIGIISLFFLIFIVNADANAFQNTQDDTVGIQLLASQDNTEEEILITMNIKEMNLADALEEFAEKLRVGISYNTNVMPDKKVTIDMTAPVYKILYKLLEDTGLEPVVPSSRDVIVIQEKKDVRENEDLFQETVRGLVVDGETGEALPGVNVVVDGALEDFGSAVGATTNSNGEYEVNVPEGFNTLIFTYIGYQSLEVNIDGRNEINIELLSDVQLLEDLVVVGYGTQRRETLTGSVSAIRSEELITTRNENPENMLTGKVAGVRVVQITSEPGSFSNVFDIRGMGNPLVVIDGVPRDNFTRMDADDIESISVLKDASAAVYGVRAANGVVLITTKRGSGEALELNYSGNMGWQYPSGSPRSVSAADWMVLQNELNMHNVNGGARRFTEDEIDLYRDGTLQDTDWYNAVMRRGAPQTNHTLSASGSAGGVNFYTSAGYQYQESFLRSDDLNYDRFNVRTNLSSQLSDNLTLSLNLNGIMDQRNRPDDNSDWIIRSFQRSNPTQPIYANNTPPFYQEGMVDGSNPITMMDADIGGYRTDDNKWFQSSMTLDFDVPHVTGLAARALVSYDLQVGDSRRFIREFNQFNYDAASDAYLPVTHNSPNRYRSEYSTSESFLYQFTVNYDFMLTEDHNLDILLLLEGSQRKADNFFAQRELALDLDRLFAGSSTNQIGSMSANPADLYEEANQGVVGRLNYDFRSKYLAEFSFRYDGSSRFGEDQQWGFFPAVSAGWLFSEESFWKDSRLSFIQYAKLRASYGKMGDDSASSYQFITGYTYPASGNNNRLPGGHLFDGSFVSSSANRGIANPNITWFTSEMANFGIELDAWSGLLEIEADYFFRERSGLLTTRAESLPVVVGASLPQENLNGDFTQGFELQLRHRNMIGGFNYGVRGLFSFTRTKNKYVEFPEAGNSYENWRLNNNDRWQGIWWGYGDIGRFTSYEDIANSETYVGRGALPGDYILEDWNGDGIISSLDEHPISYNGVPLINFGLTLNGQYKGFDLNMHFQGSAMNYVQYEEQLIQPMWGSPNSNALEMFLDRWRPTDPFADPYDHDTEWIEGHYAYTGTVAPANSYFRMNRGDYIRLKSVEIGYNIPFEWTTSIGIQDARVYVNAYNIFTLTRMEFIDPEHPADNWGNLYPLNKTVSVGLNFKF
ncbi:MAG: TonB-dependent receptor [Balneolaceae bacterium]|nr:TonB-dependent receptor [Balneolaceae bacterium]